MAKFAENEHFIPVIIQNLSFWFKLSGILFKLIEVCIGSNEEQYVQIISSFVLFAVFLAQ